MTLNEPARIPADADEVLIVPNAKAGAGPGHDRVEQLAAALRARQLAPRLVADLEAIGELAAERQRAGRLRAVVAAGGDGTVAELVNRIAAGIPLAVFPLGTENLLARYIDMPRGAEEAARVIAAGTVARQDAGNASGRLFALMVGCGFDAEVVRRLHEARDGNISRLSYLKPIWDAIRNYDYPELRIICEPGEPSERTLAARFAFIINVPRYALGLQFTPGAESDDGLFNLRAFHRGSFIDGLRYFGHVVFQSHPRIEDCTLVTVRRLRIEADRPVPYELDGDPGGDLPLDVEILPGRLTLLVPPEWFERRAAAAEDARRQQSNAG